MKQERKMDRFWWFLRSKGRSFITLTGTILLDQMLPFRPGSLGGQEESPPYSLKDTQVHSFLGGNWRCLLERHQSCGRSKATRSRGTGMEWTWKLKITFIFSGLFSWYETYFLSRSIFAYLLTLKTEDICCALRGSVVSIPRNNSSSHTHVPQYLTRPRMMVCSTKKK